jgi:hypothetical protein
MSLGPTGGRLFTQACDQRMITLLSKSLLFYRALLAT